MNASWSMVFGALLAGIVGGFMIPVRPEIRDVPALTASKATEPVKKTAADKGNDEVRKIPLTEAAAKDSAAAEDSKPAVQTTAKNGAGDCAKETWPYRSPSCLDRTAKLAPPDTVVAARRVDPTVSLQDKDTQKTMTAAAEPASKAAEAPAPKPEPAKSEQKVVTSPAHREEQAERSAPQPEQASTRRAPQPEQVSTRAASEPRAQSNGREEATANPPPRRAARRVNRDRFDDGIPTRIYLRGPDGRLYLAPEYRPSGRTVYFVR